MVARAGCVSVVETFPDDGGVRGGKTNLLGQLEPLSSTLLEPLSAYLLRCKGCSVQCGNKAYRKKA